MVLGGWDPRLLLSCNIVLIFNGVRRWLSLTEVPTAAAAGFYWLVLVEEIVAEI
jgi:hypothetical protein